MTRAVEGTTGPRRSGAQSGGTSSARVVRGTLVGLVSGLGAVVAHELAGGDRGPVESALVTVLAVLAGIGLTRWRIGLASALTLTVATQAASHLLMAGAADHAHAGAHTGAHTAAGTAGTVGTAGAAGAAGADVMLLGHLVVALLTMALVRGADRAVLDLFRVLSRWRPRRRSPLLLPLPVAHRSHRTEVVLLPGPRRVGSTPLSRRGPPVVGRLSFSTT